jgi:hypothetical protein
MIENMIEEKRKELRPDLFNQVYVDQIMTELETLQSILAEIGDMERRKTDEEKIILVDA